MLTSLYAAALVVSLAGASADDGNDTNQPNVPDDANTLAPLPFALDSNSANSTKVDDGLDPNTVADDSLPSVLDLNTTLRIFHQRGYDLLLADVNVDSVTGGVQVAGAVNNPQLGLSVGVSPGYNAQKACEQNSDMNPGDCSGTALGASFSDSSALFDIISGKRGLRIDVAQATLEAAKQGRNDAQRTLDFAVKAQYLAVAVDKANMAFAKQVYDTYQHTTNLFNIRYEAGAVSEADLARIETEMLQAGQVLDSADQQLQQDKIGLAFLLGVRTHLPEFDIQDSWLEKAGHSVADTMSLKDLIGEAQNHRPDLMAQDLQRKRAQSSIDAARRQLFPDIGLELAYTQEGTSDVAIQPPTLTLNLTFTLPLFYQYQGEIHQAVADLNSQQLLYRKISGQVTNDVGTALIALKIARAKLERMRTRLRVRAGRALELVQLQYRKGAASLLDLLDAQRTFIATNQEYFGNMSDYWTAIFQLEEAVAMEFNP